MQRLLSFDETGTEVSYGPDIGHPRLFTSIEAPLSLRCNGFDKCVLSLVSTAAASLPLVIDTVACSLQGFALLSERWTAPRFGACAEAGGQ